MVTWIPAMRWQPNWFSLIYPRKCSGSESRLFWGLVSQLWNGVTMPLPGVERLHGQDLMGPGKGGDPKVEEDGTLEPTGILAW